MGLGGRFMPGGANLSASLSTTLGGRSSDSQVLGVTDQYFKNYAVQNYFVSIEDLLKDESLRTKDESGNPILDFDEIPDGLVDRYRLDTATRRAGAGTNLYGIPNGDNPEVFFYNPNHLQQANMKIISVEEGDLAAYNAAHNTSYVAHGYAEYLQNPAPGENLASSKNRAGDTVYKVFNEAIPMNWEEMVEFSKYFTPEYDTADCKAPAGVKYGFLSEWWFFMGWSVGGDCVGFNPEIGKYEFTLADSNAKSQKYKSDQNDQLARIGFFYGDTRRFNDRDTRSLLLHFYFCSFELLCHLIVYAEGKLLFVLQTGQVDLCRLLGNVAVGIIRRSPFALGFIVVLFGFLKEILGEVQIPYSLFRTILIYVFL